MRAGIGALLAVMVALAPPAHAGFVTFETGQVRPLALSPDGARLFAINTPDSRLEIFDVDTNGDLSHAASVPVGMEPIAVAALSNAEVWVVNHLSDSISIVDVNASPARVVRTLLVGDEPRDIVVANTANGPRVFVTTAHRGQNTPLHPNIETDLRAAGQGRADVWVFDPSDLGATLGGTPDTILTFFGDTPRALAVSPDGGTVYAAVFHSGNQTTVVSEGAVCNGGTSASPCTLSDGLTVPNGMPGGQVPGGLPAPNTNFAGAPRPEVGLIVKFNNANGRWEDQEMPPRNWTNAVRFNLPDLDVFAIDADDDPPSALPTTFAHVGTVLFNMIVNPVNSKVYVTNTEARNEVRFEGPGVFGGTTVRGHLAESRITVLDGSNVLPRHLNKHISAQPQGYRTEPMTAGVKDDSLATPLGMAITSDGQTLYVAAFGSSKIGVFDTTEIENDTFTPDDADHIEVSGGGPTGLVLNETKNRLYVLTRFDNAVSVINTAGPTPGETGHLSLYNPEPANVVDGRPFLYDARFTSSNGEASCSSCHIFGDFDSLAWDLGNPDDIVLPNPNPGGVIFGAQSFHPMKGPMTTQTLRGMSTHGPMHWRGDRTGAYSQANSQPNSGAFNESLAFQAFNPAFVGLVGRDEGELSHADMLAFTNFILDVKLPPNPIRELDDSLSPAAQNGANFYSGPFQSDGVANCNGCHFLNPTFGFFGTDGTSTFENETQEFKVAHLRNMYQKIGMFGMPPVNFFNPGDNAHKGDQIRGFGFLHDGSTDTLFRFHQATVFTFPGGDTQRRDMEAFMFAFDTDLKPIVGQQTTLTDTNGATVDARIDLLIARALAGDCELIVKGTVGGEDRGWVFRTVDSRFHSDRLSEATLVDNDLRAEAAVAGQALTYTCVPPGSGDRAGIDRDEDGHRDRDELDAGSDPADPTSVPQCPSVPPVGCKAPGKSLLLMRATAGKEALKWKWLKGAQTDPAELGNPVSGGTNYSLCLYAGGSPALIANVGPVVQAACGTAPCFKSTATGYRYKDSAAGNDGIHSMVLKSGAAGKAKMIVKGKGGALPLPNLNPSGLTLPVQAVLQNNVGECWSATYTTAIKNDPTLFKAK